MTHAFDPWSATFEEAIRHPDGTSIVRWGAARRVEALQAKAAKGSGAAVLEAVALCASADLVMPTWLTDDFTARYARAMTFEVKSWDEAFDPPPRDHAIVPRKHVDSLRRDHEMQWRVTRDVLQRSGSGEAEDKELFAAVGATHGIGGNLAEELYRAFMKRHRLPSMGALKRRVKQRSQTPDTPSKPRLQR